jgi:hypothetical protein
MHYRFPLLGHRGRETDNVQGGRGQGQYDMLTGAETALNLLLLCFYEAMRNITSTGHVCLTLLIVFK